jgi:hypothetical protein
MAQHHVAGADTPPVLPDREVEPALLDNARAEHVRVRFIGLIFMFDRMVEPIEAEFARRP